MNGRQRLLGISVMLVSVIAPSFSAALALSKAEQEGLMHLQAGRYQHAEQYLRVAVKDEPRSATAHYYLANVLVRVNKHSEAIAEYQASYRLDPFGPVSGYCRRALITYGVNAADFDTADSVTSERIPKAPRLAVATNDVGNAVDSIRKQAEAEKDRHRQAAERLSTDVLRSAEVQAKQIQDAAKDEIDRIQNAPVLIGRGYNPYYSSPEMRKQVQQNADEAAQLARNRAAKKALEFKQWSDEHECRVDESAANLEKQLHERNLPGTPRLAAGGTSLYVRNYQAPDEPSPYPEPHASVARIHRTLIGPQNAADGNESEVTAKRDFAGPDNTVRGVVLTH